MNPMNPAPRVAVVVLAAGTGRRLGQSEPKAFVNLAGKPILGRALEAVFAMVEPVQVIVTAPAAYVPLARQVAAAARAAERHRVSVIAGGATRQESVRISLAELLDGVEVVLVHDAARPLTPTVVFDAVAAEVLRTGVAVVPGLPVTDTIKRIDDDGVVVETVDRDELAAVQTPQAIPRTQLERAHAAAGSDFTDDAALVASLGHPVAVIAGDRLSFKITTAWELRQAESLVDRSPASVIRVGTGVDVHA
ncbi:MAG: 2-C-methyl-D-erythritol 4-phosphate cytidylyltransferase, partial [Micrococcales bacterium]|nr:2-C-methyl-D-erythritol 4-phosphate cytidylyltransferase [Micrococcales bacterium]